MLTFLLLITPQSFGNLFCNEMILRQSNETSLNVTSVLWNQQEDWTTERWNRWLKKITFKLESWNAKPSVAIKWNFYFCSEIKWNATSVLLNRWDNWQYKLKSNLCWKIMFKSEDGVYCKCNVYSSVSIEGGPAFVVNIPAQSTH